MFNKSAACLLLWASATASFAQTTTDIQIKSGSSAYLQDHRNVVVRSSSGLCWRAAHWTSTDAIPGCDGELVVPVAKVTAPEIVSPSAPTPTPVAAPVSPSMQVRRCDFSVTLDNDQVFSFGRSSLRPSAKVAIDNAVMAKLKDCKKIELITITAHADRLGSEQYNQALTDRRAESVAAYFKSSGVSAQIDTFGAGKRQAIKNCDMEHDAKRLVDCLAPNRRVVIAIRGLAK
ncbi:hypothetical protein BH11PSE11_BH11PSE11_37060 [soil metagenome]